MGLLKWLRGPGVAQLASQGEAQLAEERWSEAKLSFEHALARLAKETEARPGQRERLEGNLRRACEGLARAHLAEADELIAAGLGDEARDLLELTVELTADASLRETVTERLAAIAAGQASPAIDAEPEWLPEPEESEEMSAVDVDDDEAFDSLLGTLPEDQQKAYPGYGDRFRAGYLALNRGDFEAAAADLETALEEHGPDSFVPLELAAAYLNRNRSAEAVALLEDFLGRHPANAAAYRLLCDAFWEAGQIERAGALLTRVPAELRDTEDILLLSGETLHRAGRTDAARDVYRHYLDTRGWSEAVARHLAVAHEALGERQAALALYRQIISECTGCRRRVDPVVKHRYAELCFAEGRHDSATLELYLNLAREIPANAAGYYERISHIYASQGHTAEATRFAAFAQQAGAQGRS